MGGSKIFEPCDMNKMRLLHFASIAVVFFLFSWGITDGHIGLDDWGYTREVQKSLSFAIDYQKSSLFSHSLNPQHAARAQNVI